jgi:tetratricopeptide (TPR) repeat protein
MPAKPGRNEACPCGSGKKFKGCCGQAPDSSAARAAREVPALNQTEITAFSALIDRGQWNDAELLARAMLATRPDIGMLWKILSVALVRQNKEALPALRRSAELLPSDPEAHVNLAATLRTLGQWQEALAALRHALKLSPNDVEANIRAADILNGHGDPQTAVGHYQRALRHNPGLAQAHNNLGNAFTALARHADAALAYREALKLAPKDARIHCNLSDAQRNLGRLPEAVASARRAVALDPHLADAHNQLGLSLAAQGEFEQASTSYRTALMVDHRHVDALNNLGNALRDAGDRSAAMASYAQAVEIDPQRADGQCNLGNMLFEFQRFDEAAACYARALAIKPDYREAHLSLSMALRMQGRSTDAEARCRAALAIDPDYPEALTLLGELHADQGQFSEAESLFRRAIHADPNFPVAYFDIAMHRKMTDDPQWLAKTQTLLGRRLPLRHAIALNYALGKYFDDTKQYERAFDSYHQANELSKRNAPAYDAAGITRHVDTILEDFTASALRESAKHGDPSKRPTFVVGMPRSGTSLTEQILASHPAIFGAGEINYWDDALKAHQEAVRAGTGPQAIRTIAGSYLRRVAQLSEAPRVVDKMPPNFMNLGLIHMALPNARIIHMRRHPIDTCLSIYFQYFLSTHPFANDLGSLTHYYREYLRVMEHWRRVLPPGVILEIPYESLIGEQETWSRRMLAFLDLPWDARCLDFQDTQRVVLTASKWQVRQKLHGTSSGRWRNYQKFVGPLRELAPAEDP